MEKIRKERIKTIIYELVWSNMLKDDVKPKQIRKVAMRITKKIVTI